MTPIELIDAACESLEDTLQSSTVRVNYSTAGQGDGARVTIQTASDQYTFLVEAKRQMNVALAARPSDRLDDKRRHKYILITEYVGASVAEVLRSRHINFLDASGNCHIEQPPLLIHVEGRKRVSTGGSSSPVRAFTGEGLKVIFVVLLRPELVSRTYRELATLSGASHGVVQYTMNDLERLGFIVRIDRGTRRVLNPADLIDRWAIGYGEHLRPKLSMGTFRFTTDDQLRKWREIRLDESHERWGGEPAATLMTERLKPGRLTIHSNGTRSAVMKRLRVVPDVDGQVEILRAFWQPAIELEVENDFREALVPKVVAYADLLAGGEPRNAQVAAILREQVLDGLSK
ncbi:MAG: type IV toxin-antitoxin system AbiEi family antitoxin [Rhodothermales bacterium]